MLHPSTEVLTQSGWYPVSSLTERERIAVGAGVIGPRMIELQWVSAYEVMSDRVEKLRHVRNTNIDLRVTGDQRICTFVGSSPSSVPASKFSPRTFPSVGYCVGPGAHPDDHVLCMAVVINRVGELHGDVVRFHVRGAQKYRVLANLLTRYCAAHQLLKSRKWTLHVPAKLLAVPLSLLDGADLCWKWLDMSHVARVNALGFAQLLSCTPAGGRSFWYTAPVHSLDVLQAVAAITGRKSKLAALPGGGHRLSVSDHAWSCCGKNLRNVAVPHNGTVYGVRAVGPILVRDGGIPVFVEAEP